MAEKISKLIGVKELAEFLDISIETLYSWVYQRKIPYLKIGRLVKFNPLEIEEWIKERRVEVFSKIA